jgi:hypothetical protein
MVVLFSLHLSKPFKNEKIHHVLKSFYEILKLKF